MEKIFHVEGMMCEHCENRVTKALSQIDGIQECTASTKDKSVICRYDDTKITEAAIKQAIEDTGYDVVA